VSPIALSPGEWERHVGELADGAPLDLLVVGGGIVGSGAALDAVSRGLRVAVVEAQDWSSGTSSRSSKLIHGGLRYLEMFDFALVREALRERALLLRLAPHLVRPTPFLFPLTRRVWERAYVGAGVGLYDLLARSSRTGGGLPRHRQLTRRAALRIAPCLCSDALVGAIQYYDARVDDSRFALAVVRTAVDHGALAVNRVAAVGLVREGEAVVGARLRLLETGREFEVRARAVLLATGVWSEEVEALAGRERPLRVRPSKGVHIVVARDRIDSSSALIVPTEKSVLFVIPWGEHWVIGTTDTPWEYDKARPAASAADIGYLLERVNRVLASPIGVEDVVAVYAGLRPLIAGAAEETTKLSREHAVGRPAPGLVVVSGGKYTTYRVMASDAVDAVVDHAGLDAPRSATASVPILGGEGYAAAWAARAELARSSGLGTGLVEHLLERYGTLAGEVLALAASDASLALGIPGAEGYLRAEAVYAVTHEGARHLEDVLARRTRAAIETSDRAASAAEDVAALMAPHLGWDGAQARQEVEGYRLQVEAEQAAERQPDDRAADAAMRGAPALLPLP
jgi:glycerol-3-phosphate dehydrogenase